MNLVFFKIVTLGIHTNPLRMLQFFKIHFASSFYTIATLLKTFPLL